MRRRDFITLIFGAVAEVSPLAVARSSRQFRSGLRELERAWPISRSLSSGGVKFNKKDGRISS